MTEKLCACGCGTQIASSKTFVHNHHHRARDDAAIFQTRYSIDEDGCWMWNGSLHKGYPSQFGKGGRTRPHRWAYEHFVGPIPEDLTLDHLCHTNSDCPGGTSCKHRACVNPAHLEPVSRGENTLRGNSPLAQKARMERCPQGHEFTEVDPGKYRRKRRCLICIRERDRTQKARKRAEARAKEGATA